MNTPTDTQLKQALAKMLPEQLFYNDRLHPDYALCTADDAKKEAERLAAKHPQERFTVMQSMEVYVATINPPQALKCVINPSTF
jgi:hypothetical protein